VNDPSLDQIIERLQFCIVSARDMQLKVLERILSIALLEAYETRIIRRGVEDDDTDQDGDQP
jgi:hypothetical protein